MFIYWGGAGAGAGARAGAVVGEGWWRLGVTAARADSREG